MTLQTVIVDDEVPARELLRSLLAPYSDIHIVAECRNGSEAIAYLREHSVDLVFLDVQMPRVNGFDVVREIGTAHLPCTIFTTAFNEYAVRAFEIHAIDYLTKPIEAERLQSSMTRVLEHLAAKAALASQEQFTGLLNTLVANVTDSRELPQHLLVKDSDREILLPVERIDWVEAAEYYCCLHVGDRSYMLRETISDLEQRLNPRRFLRIHRSTIVRVDQIREIFRESQTESSVVLKTGRALRMSRAGRQRLAEYASYGVNVRSAGTCQTI